MCVTLQGLWMIDDRIVDFRFFGKFHWSGPAIMFSFWTINEHVSYALKKAPNKGKDHIKMVCFTLEGWWIVREGIIDFRFFVKFHESGPAKIFSVWTTTEHVSYASKKFLIKEKTSLTWGVLLWKHYGWFMTYLSIFDFLSNFTCPDLQ